MHRHTLLFAALVALGCQDPASVANLCAASPDRLEPQGWEYIRAARDGDDHHLYERAEQCALEIASLEPGSHPAALLRGNALQGQHRFRDARRIAERLVEERGLAHDWALLGDAAMEEGDLALAERAYQRMVDLRPDASAYSRVAHFRELVGDTAGARDLMRWAARAVSPRTPDDFAWVWSRLALYELALGNADAALEIAERAVAVAPTSRHAQQARARILMQQEMDS